LEESAEKLEASARAKSIEKRNLYILALFVMVSLAFLSVNITLSVMAGGLITVVNFRILWKGVEGLLQKKQVSQGLLYLGIFIKFILLIGLIGIIVIKLPIHTGAFLIGLSSIVLALISEVFYARV